MRKEKIEIEMKMNKEEFLKTELGLELECCIRAWNRSMQEQKKITSYSSLPGLVKKMSHQDWIAISWWCEAEWKVFQMAIKQFYGVEYHFVCTDEYFGIATNDVSDWLIKIKKEEE